MKSYRSTTLEVNVCDNGGYVVEYWKEEPKDSEEESRTHYAFCDNPEKVASTIARLTMKERPKE